MLPFPNLVTALTGIALTVFGSWRHDPAMAEIGLVLIFTGMGIVAIFHNSKLSGKN